MRKLLYLAVLLITMGIACGAFSTLVFSRAHDAEQRLNRSLSKAEEELEKATKVEHSDPQQYKELIERANRWATFAEFDGDEYAELLDGARYFAAGASILIAAGVFTLIVRRRRMSRAPVPADHLPGPSVSDAKSPSP